MPVQENLKQEFFDFIYRRHLIWYKRFVLKEHPPWTEDKVLQKYKLINMYRELDKCTIYLLKKLTKLNDRKSILLNVVFYRFFNRYGLYEELEIEPFKEFDEKIRNKLIQMLEIIESEQKPIFNNAYLISGKAGEKKYVSVLNSISQINLDKMIGEIDNCKNPEESFEILKEIPMVGPFLACEIWTDLTYLEFFRQGWNDNDFVNVGPGAKWGLEIIYGGKLSCKEAKQKLNELYEMQEYSLPEKWKKIAYEKAFSNYPYLSITNIEGALCEFRKYWNIKHGKGRRKHFVPSQLHSNL